MPQPPTDAAPNAADQPPAPAPSARSHDAARRVAPFFASVVMHLGLVGVGMIVTWTVVTLTDEDPVRIVADFDAITYQPVAVLPSEAPQRTDRPVPLETDTPTVEELLRAREETPLDPTQYLSTARAPSSTIDFSPAPDAGSARFLGISATNARDIVYVIDASGSMIPYLPIVLQELARSLEALAAAQRFAIIFFQEDEAIVVPPVDRLSPASDAARLAALTWIDEHVVPRGGTNPLVAIERALRLKPDAIFLLSQNITGFGRFEVDQQDLLDLLDPLNPVDAKLDRRRTQINCIQFLDPDPLDTMRLIAERHGGAKGYKFLDRRELGFSQP